jgi:hypothetical protein
MDSLSPETAAPAICTGVAFYELPLTAEGTATGASRLAGSARWVLDHGVGHPTPFKPSPRLVAEG